MNHIAKLKQAWAVAAALTSLALPVWAQYKIVGADGSITYTDRPPSDARGGRVLPIGRTPGAAEAAAQPSQNLPVELRQVSQRYPVTLYTSADCPACDNGRQWLAQRGVPYRERRIETEQDAQALVGLVGARLLPSLTIGAQPVRGYSETDWLAYLDAAGYPRESKLPRGWQPPPVTALVEAPPRPTAVVAPAAAVRPVRPVPAPAALPASVPQGSVRF